MREEVQLYLNDIQVAARFGISRNSVWRMVKTGQLPAPINLFKATTRWRLSDLEAFEAARAAEPRQSGMRVGHLAAARAAASSKAG